MFRGLTSAGLVNHGADGGSAVQEPVAEPQQAPGVFTHMLGEAGLDVSTMRAAGAWAVFVTFARVPFAVPQLPDADGLLYQLGTYSFSGEPRFHLDFTRQFALPDDDEYLQFHCDLQFTATAELQALGSHDEWWWPDEERDLTAWAMDVASRPEWALLASRTPLTTEIYCEHT
jgi:hypothetical protein